MGNQQNSKVKESDSGGENENNGPKDFTIKFSPSLLTRLSGAGDDDEYGSGDAGDSNEEADFDEESGDDEYESNQQKVDGVLSSAERAREKAIEDQTSEQILRKVNSIIKTTVATDAARKSNDSLNAETYIEEACSNVRDMYLDCIRNNINVSSCGEVMNAYSDCVSASK
mmetsp:Transcript_13541/g.17655  ORF Transcript_13541/g.17655 Transcript_13541/m.17655 type:complete len:170 (-) Transcript_13541:204-713(-)|eukprot:CAMPEP_0184023420 /NCGR_PEP_ID=MMETSP0954-20121128/11352_1 /TAXON_ID=627963 /ORGANISM="Aplanochytrium sp, Strain PBS07" /LENGTH=169 /DNA_ID=CAMNT_0026306305 /DNA_START=70 /DNA_END=579 /DNA_ORIENTATION=-